MASLVKNELINTDKGQILLKRVFICRIYVSGNNKYINPF